MDTDISYIIVATIILWFISKVEVFFPREDKLADIGPDCRHSEEYKCADEILRDIFFANPHDTAKQTQHIGIFYGLWKKVRKYHYKQYSPYWWASLKDKISSYPSV